jgi:hypothetical protein
MHREEYPALQNIPIVVVASTPRPQEDLFKQVDAVDLICPDCYFTKPVDIFKLLDVLEQLLGQQLCA